ncbi:MAG: DNA helicase RecQ [Oscillospiraceae bacterium]|nr:DNA helicase RecQ [Oscillospiraceae bacterium]
MCFTGGVSDIQKEEVLRQYFGHHAFRPGQEELIDALLDGRDVLGVMPTGAGKSVCYQIPALMLPGITLVISPLISLMKDQVAALKQAGVAAAYINSSLSYTQYLEVLRRAKNGDYKIIYVAPERLSTEGFLSFAQKAELSLLAVDEAHCVSQWGHEFRPSYLKIAEFCAALPKRPPVGAFTATATNEVKSDIVKLLGLHEPLELTTGFDRPNLFFAVETPGNKDAWLNDFISERREQCGIIYCATRKNVEKVCGLLQECGYAATRYHAGLEDDERRENQEDFLYDRAHVMVATNAFGMGIDKSNVSYVVHYNMPKNIESYYQEAGRAGRDGSRAECVLLYSPLDMRTAKFLIENSEDNEELTEEERAVVRERDLARLIRMAGYCKTTDCLRRYILQYFGEKAPIHCANCGNCCGKLESFDITTAAQKILSGVTRVERKYSSGFGVTMIVRMLHGSKEQRVLELGLDRLPTYGIMEDTERSTIRSYIDCLIENGYLRLTEGDYPVLCTTEKAKNVLFGGEQVEFVGKKKEKPKKKKTAERQTPDDSLYATLSELRFEIAKRESVPAFVVFSNATLQDMAAKQPETMTEFLDVNGVGSKKAERYGKAFVDRIRAWKGSK